MCSERRRDNYRRLEIFLYHKNILGEKNTEFKIVNILSIMSRKQDFRRRPYFEIEEREFTFEHEGFPVCVTIWNESSTPQPRVLFDYNNVLNVYTIESLQRETETSGLRYAIVSLLITKGHNFLNLRERSYQTGETIVALTCESKGDQFKVETGIKYLVTELLGWTEFQKAIDDKPHEWLSTISPSRQQISVLNPKYLTQVDTAQWRSSVNHPKPPRRVGPEQNIKPVYQIVFLSSPIT